jgi:hypothetical protein
VTSLLLSCPQTMQWSKEPLRSSFAHGAGTRTISRPSGSMKISSLKTLTEGSGTRFLRHSANQSEKVDLVLSLPNLLRPIQSEPPWTAWHRPTNWLTEPTQDWTPMESLLSFYSGN